MFSKPTSTNLLDFRILELDQKCVFSVFVQACVSLLGHSISCTPDQQWTIGWADYKKILGILTFLSRLT